MKKYGDLIYFGPLVYFGTPELEERAPEKRYDYTLPLKPGFSLACQSNCRMKCDGFQP